MKIHTIALNYRRMKRRKPKSRRKTVETPPDVVFNVRMEPSLRAALEPAANTYGMAPASMIRQRVFSDVQAWGPFDPDLLIWIKKETRSANFTFVAPPILAKAMRERARALKLTITDYVRSVAIHEVLLAEGLANEINKTNFNPKAKPDHPILRAYAEGRHDRQMDLGKTRMAMENKSDHMISGYTTYRGEDIVAVIQAEAAKEGLSLAAYQKMLVFRDIEQKYGLKFLAELLNTSQEAWDMQDGYLKRMLEARK